MYCSAAAAAGDLLSCGAWPFYMYMYMLAAAA